MGQAHGRIDRGINAFLCNGTAMADWRDSSSTDIGRASNIGTPRNEEIISSERSNHTNKSHIGESNQLSLQQ